MFTRKYFSLLIICSILLSQILFSQIVFQGTITDNGAEYLGSSAEPVANALVTLTDQADAQRIFTGYTNDQGEYSIQISSTGVDDDDSNNPGRFNLLQNYPNPFNPSTVIGYVLNKPSNITIEIYNVLGQKIRTLFDGYQTAGSGRIIWDASNDLGKGVSAGVYIYSLRADGININKKMLLIDGQQGSTNLSMSQSTDANTTDLNVLNKLMSDQYTLTVTGDSIAAYEQQNLEITGNMTLDLTVNRTVTDIDGNVYSTVKIGDQWWLGENLKVTHYRNGEDIPHVTDGTEWNNLSTDAYCNFNNDSSNVVTYGRLYNWFAVNDSLYIAPDGWHVPTNDEWSILMTYLEGESVSGGKMKETGTAHWDSPNTGATNESGFTALGTGCRFDINGYFIKFGQITYFWSSTEYNDSGAWYHYLNYDDSYLSRYNKLKQYGFSVRLIRD
ncbi:T9SS type A sorting domain-containing protein [candidate division KSB1 bacterium]|nr:T9SS type A sorting domain-containing protein [candidate division KSB1 bacterium]